MSNQPGFFIGQPFLGQDSFVGSSPQGSREPQRQKYQAFLERTPDDKFVGYIREVNQRFPIDSTDHKQALHMLGHDLCVYAGNQRLAKLPEPLGDRIPKDAMPANVAVMAEVEVVYDPEGWS